MVDNNLVSTKKFYAEFVTTKLLSNDINSLNELSSMTHSSTETLYTVLGVVLAAILIVLTTLLLACIVKQRLHQRLFGKHHKTASVDGVT